MNEVRQTSMMVPGAPSGRVTRMGGPVAGSSTGGLATRLAAFLVLAVAQTWPLVPHAATRVPLGTEPVATVPLFNLWTLRWTSSRVPHLFSGWWDAPIFWPRRGTFAFSEIQPLTGVLFTALQAVVRNPVLAYNLLLLAFLALNGLAGQRLARRVGARPFPAMIVGALAQTLPFVGHELGVLQLVVLWPMLVTLEQLVAWSEEPSWRPAAGVGLALSATFLTSTYFGLFLAIVLVGAGWVLLTRRGWLGLDRIAEVALAGAVCSLLVLPVLLIQRRDLAGFSWSAATVRANSARPTDWLHASPQAGWIRLPGPSGFAGQPLWPGTALVVLGVTGLVLQWRAGHRRRAGFVVLGVAIAFVVSLGRRGGPVWLIVGRVPGLDHLRSPFRMAVLAQVLLLVPGAVALDRLWQWRRGRFLVLMAVMVAALEVLTLPAPTARVPAARTIWSTWLRQHPGGVVAMVPGPADGRVESYEPTLNAMLLQLDHHHPIVDGYSGFFPASYDRLVAAEQDFPSPASIRALRRAGVTWLVIDRAWAEFHRPGLRAAGVLRYRDAEVEIRRLAP